MSSSNVNLDDKAPIDTLYVGRFAPSPSGRLHFGSLVSAIASFCDARAHYGKWLVRMEDLDPPREEAGASDAIIQSLESHGLIWDDKILYQSQRLNAYEGAFSQLQDSIYPCSCIRQRIASLGGRYDGHCRDNTPPDGANVAWRVNTQQHTNLQADSETFTDIFLGKQHLSLDIAGDCIIKRKDTLFSYQLAVVVDDIFQGVTHIIRGQDLLDSTYWQRYLYLLIKGQTTAEQVSLPQYGHTPLALGRDEHKLSKQTKAAPINNDCAVSNVIAALRFLGHPPPDDLLTTSTKNGKKSLQQCIEILAWASDNWDRTHIPKKSSVAPALADA